MPFAFRCKNCGRLESPDNAGECEHPHSCTVCGAGVTLNPKTKALAGELADPNTTIERRTAIAAELLKLSTTGDNEKKIHADNWEHLCEATDERLVELGLSRNDVVKHTAAPKTASRSPQDIARTATEGAVVQDTPTT